MSESFAEKDTLSTEEQIYKETLQAFLKWFVNPFNDFTFYMNYGSIICDIFMLIFFCFTRNPNYRKSFFILLIVGYSLHFLNGVFLIFINTRIFFEIPNVLISKIILTFFNYWRAYFTTFFPIWNATLVLNKITALWMPLKHDKIWTKNFWKALTIMLTIPALIFFYFFARFHCYVQVIDAADYNARDANCPNDHEFFVSAFLTDFAILSLILTIIILHKKTIKTLSAQIAKAEKRFMFQALISLGLYAFHFNLGVLGQYECSFVADCRQWSHDYYVISFILSLAIKFFKNLAYLNDVFFLILISKSLRIDFLNFYTFNLYEKLFTNSNSTRVITINPKIPKITG